MDSDRFGVFKDSLARRIVSKPGMLDAGDSASDLDEFILYLATQLWPDLPMAVQNAAYESRSNVPDIDTLSLDSISIDFTESLVSYGIADDAEDAHVLLRKALSDYIKEQCAPPPPWSSTRTAECAICEREVPLTYHHLIPRSTHARVLKKGWHPEHMLNSVAWLCRPCHSAVHHVAPNETLAREFYTVELLLEREDIQRWRAYAAKQRYGVKRG